MHLINTARDIAVAAIRYVEEHVKVGHYKRSKFEKIWESSKKTILTNDEVIESDTSHAETIHSFQLIITSLKIFRFLLGAQRRW